MKQGTYIFENCKEATLLDLTNVINDGLLKHECSFDDSLLLLCKMVDNEKFIQNLKTIADECLSNEKQNIVKSRWFIEAFLKSNIWASNTGNSNATDSTNNKAAATSEKSSVESNQRNDSNADDTKTNEKKDDTLKQGKTSHLFDEFKETIIAQQIEHQKEYIREQMLELEKNHFSSFQDLQSGIKRFHLDPDYEVLRQSHLDRGKYDRSNIMSEKNGAIHPIYNINELPINNSQGFNGADDYDHNGYLSRLLIVSHQVTLCLHAHSLFISAVCSFVWLLH